MKLLLTFVCFFSFIFQLQPQNENPRSPILFIYDASGSMWGQMDGKTKKEIASNVLSSTINDLPENQHTGLIAYGHRKKGDCNDIEFLVDLKNSNKDNVIKAIKNISPLGKTPLARSATLAINSLRESKTKATIILVTDGIESCDGNICEIVSSAKSEGIDFKLHIIGFGLKKSETEQLKCAAKAGNGNYYDASNSGGLSDVLTDATQQTVDKPEGNFSIFIIKNGKPIDAWIKAQNAKTDEVADRKRTYRDTVFLYLPTGKYKLTIQPLENTKIMPITLTVKSIEEVGGHQTVSFDAGKLNITTLNNNEGWDSTIKVLSQDGKAVTGSRTYSKPKLIELSPGMYDIKLIALRIKGLEVIQTIEDVVVEPNKTTDISHNFKSGIAKIGVKTATELVDATISIRAVNGQQHTGVANGRTYTKASNNPKEFILNPGTYQVSILTLGKHKGKKETFNIEVKPGETVEKTITY